MPDGLTRHPSLDERWDPAVRIVPYDPAWPERARAEMVLIRKTLGAVAETVEHIGSTSVPGLAAKPIVDLQLSVRAIERRGDYVEALEGLGYLFAEDPESPDFHFFAKPPARPRALHLHVCQAGGHHELRHIAVRDFLRTHPDEAAEYAALKTTLAARHPGDRLGYISGKEIYAADLEARALAWVSASSGRPGASRLGPPGGPPPRPGRR